VKHHSFFPAAALACAILAAGCGKNPVQSRGDVICDHVDADGIRLSRQSVVLAQQWQATVSGGVMLDVAAPLDSVLVQFLAPDSSVISGGTIACGDKSLQWIVADSSVVSLRPSAVSPWGVRFVGRAAGTTTVRFLVKHVDHADFTSQPIPVTVTGPSPHVSVGAVNALLFKGCSRVSSWAWHVPGVYGKLVVNAESTRRSYAVQDIPAYVVPDATGYALVWTVADPSKASVDTVPGRPWHFRVQGLVAGHTTVTFRLVWNGTVELTTGAFDVVVENPAAPAPLKANFLLKKSGVRHVFVRNDTLVASCGSSVATGFLPAKLDTIDDLHFGGELCWRPPGSAFSLCSSSRTRASRGSSANTGEYFDTCEGWHGQTAAHQVCPPNIVWFRAPLPVHDGVGTVAPGHGLR
jgi:hypothetical protein